MGRFADRFADVSLRAKITGVTVFILFLGLIVAGVGTLSVLRPMLLNNQESTLRQLHEDPTPALAAEADVDNLTREDVLFAGPQFYVAVLDADGDLQYDNTHGKSSSAWPDVDGMSAPISVESVSTGREQPISIRSGDGTEWRAVALTIGVSGQPGGTLLIASTTAGINQTVAQYVVIFTAFGIAVLLLGAALTRILVTATFLPLAEVERTALEISRGDYSKRIMVASPHTEVGHLGESLNIMLDRLDGSLEERARTIERMRRFIGDASHELRTPLVSVRGYAELYRMGALQEGEQTAQAMERIEKEAIRMTSLVEDLLALARLDERRPLELAQLPLNGLAHDAALDAGVQDPDRAITAIEDPAAPVVVGDEHKVRQLMTNLLGNAMRHTPAGSPIEIVVSSVPAGDGVAPMARFEIVDHGEGIPEQIREKIFGRFWRADTSRNRETGGSGLGLAIVKSIVDAHGGSVSVHETPGGGATFRVDLPSAPPGDDTVPVPRV
ncbi:HAMP domain-containing histidine kinase [Leucobacter allii]|uniref:histidine kinase n=1 Tax=Leucobacter allii TaxID=2932247 RepID=A0ABY4FJR3_9MICO|nr:HAMP domain-containing sensor histidine kinase [Leucobacter allii]UOQ56416.1 HAMP domain-containing histidine kinase [Leucobacter allii]UOR00853.1 HAMP domain-containing histidine kinase [Leucobacter allii]